MKSNCCQKGSKEQGRIKEIKHQLNVINDINRLRILCLLSQHKELCVCEIFKALKLEQNLTSYHLRVLLKAGFLNCKKQGNKIIYSQNKNKAKLFTKEINKLLKT